MPLQYIVEHLEGPLETWALLEYVHMCQIVGDQNMEFTKFPNNEDFSKITQTQFKPTIQNESLSQLKTLMNWSRTCLLDMNAENALTPMDKENFDCVVFGGILGNVPSDDRTSEIRILNFDHRRHLGPIQMTTDTAIMVSKIVLEDQVPLEQIPYVDEPEIQLGACEVAQLSFRFVSKSFFTKNESDRDIPILADGLVDYLKESLNESIDG